MSHKSSAARPSSAVFFDVCGCALTQFEIAELFRDRGQLLYQPPEAMVFLQLQAGAVHGGADGNDPRHRLAGNGMGQRIGRAMTFGTLLGAMASRLAAFTIPGYERTRTHVADLSKFGFELIALQAKSIEIERSGHDSPDSIIRCQYNSGNNLPVRFRFGHHSGVVHPNSPWDLPAVPFFVG
jgi:hypothetical protein